MEIKGFHFFTFLFQIINFFILLLILSRLLYRPLKNFMEKRRAELSKCIIDAENIKKEAMELAKTYEEKLKELENKKEEIIESKVKEAEEEAQKIIERAKREAEKIFEKEKTLLQKEIEKAEGILREKTLVLLIDFLERFLRELPLEDLHHILSEKAFKTLPKEFKKLNPFFDPTKPYNVKVVSAFSSSPTKDQIQKLLEEQLQKKVEISILEEPSLLAGFKVKIEGYVLDFSLSGQIKKLRKSLE